MELIMKRFEKEGIRSFGERFREEGNIIKVESVNRLKMICIVSQN